MPNDHIVKEMVAIKAFNSKTKLEMFVVKAGWFVVKSGQLLFGS